MYSPVYAICGWQIFVSIWNSNRNRNYLHCSWLAVRRPSVKWTLGAMPNNGALVLISNFARYLEQCAALESNEMDLFSFGGAYGKVYKRNPSKLPPSVGRCFFCLFLASVRSIGVSYSNSVAEHSTAIKVERKVIIHMAHAVQLVLSYGAIVMKFNIWDVSKQISLFSWHGNIIDKTLNNLSLQKFALKRVCVLDSTCIRM